MPSISIFVVSPFSDWNVLREIWLWCYKVAEGIWEIVDVYETPQVILPAFKLSMKDSVADWLSKLPPNVVGDFGLLRAAFLERFVPN